MVSSDIISLKCPNNIHTMQNLELFGLMHSNRFSVALHFDFLAIDHNFEQKLLDYCLLDWATDVFVHLVQHPK